MTKNERIWLAEALVEKFAPELCHPGQTATEAAEHVKIRKALLRLPTNVLNRIGSTMMNTTTNEETK